MDQMSIDDAVRWPKGETRVPFQVYRSPQILDQEQRLLFEGPVWNYLCLETEIPNIGDWRTTFVGRMPVVVARTESGDIAAFENRCLHRGALICLDNAGNAKDFTCVYHAWRYDLGGNLKSIAFSRGVNGKGGMPDDFRPQDLAVRKPRIATFSGLVFATFSDVTPSIEDFIGPEVSAALRLNASRKLQVIGRFTEVLQNNWKLYAENVRDTYHASLLHVFFATFRINRLSQGGGVSVSETGACHVSTTLAPTEEADNSYDGMRSVDDELRLSDPSMLDAEDEHGDRVRQQIISVFPSFAMQRTYNVMAIRQFVPRGVDKTDLNWIYLGYADDSPALRRRRLKQLNLAGPAGFVSMEDGCIGNFVERGAAVAADGVSLLEMGGAGMESQDTRATETAIRGFWKTWRAIMRQ
ncbi:aromatic ring-hydroxylating oxygenase subunit alpha [Rhodopila sp.]|uniref:aromatic ring-hydroxylating oxygenase subunit alpha n=1 Tax=Rhodopila sp. TaxID=2480087 RepID=UPI003D0D9E6F